MKQDETLEMTSTEKLYIMSGAAQLVARNGISFSFTVIKTDGTKIGMPLQSEYWISDETKEKLLALILEYTKGRAQIFSNLAFIQAYDFKEARGSTPKEAVVNFLVKNWFHRINNSWALNFPFRDKVKVLLIEGS